MILQNIIDIAEICSQKQVNEVVLSPGSRCAPLTLAFSRHPKIHCRVISDERAAGFIALGMASELHNTVILVCTSGSASLNYYPAIAEAFYQHVPLLIFTADRPAEWVGQRDGQTVDQLDLYKNHVKKSYHIPLEDDHPNHQWYVNRMINEAINLSLTPPFGPVHLNVPFREPFYPKPGEKYEVSEEVRIINHFEYQVNKSLSSEYKKELLDLLWSKTKVLIVAGQTDFDQVLLKHLNEFSIKLKIPVICDVISNCQSLQNAIIHQDCFLGALLDGEKEELNPDLIISFGLSVISKQLKIFLRSVKNVTHWHIQSAGEVADTFQSLTDIIRLSPKVFFKSIQDTSPIGNGQQGNYLSTWQQQDEKVQTVIGTIFNKVNFNEFQVVKEILDWVPDNSILHLANSMPVRYVNFLGLKNRNIEIKCNRGTSGIDGCSSTALGNALVTRKTVTLITGDMAMFYDRNAFWHQYHPKNLRIIILNNHGGGIFGLIQGPANQPELEEFFITNQPLTATNLAQEYDMNYFNCHDFEKLTQCLAQFFDDHGKIKILEIETDRKDNEAFFNAFKNNLLTYEK